MRGWGGGGLGFEGEREFGDRGIIVMVWGGGGKWKGGGRGMVSGGGSFVGGGGWVLRGNWMGGGGEKG